MNANSTLYGIVCFECSAPATCRHHVVPRSRGGTATVPLCGACHGRVHGVGDAWTEHSSLTAAAMADMKAGGFYTGGAAPYGYRVDTEGRLVADEDEQAVKRAAAKLRAAGLSLRAVGAALAARGLLPRDGGAWSPAAVSRLMKASLEVGR